jgi:alpha-L-rhamnosidase
MLYHQYGDLQPIRKHYPAMKKWLGYMKQKYMNKDGIITKDSYGDWCVPPESPELIHSKDSSRITDPQLIATAYYYYLLRLMEKFATLTGSKDDAICFAGDAAKVRSAFNKKFYHDATAEYGNNTVTANLLPLAFDMISNGDRERVFKNISDKILNENHAHLSTGVIGTQWIMRWLTKYDRADLAYQIASNTSYPSWGYMVKNGATTIWELWNGNTANPSMNSQNHVMLLGDLLIWMYENLGGIQSDSSEAGFKRIIMRPSFEVDLNQVNASYQSPYGVIISNWQKENEQLKWHISIPANTCAIIYMPAKSIDMVKDGDKSASNSSNIKFLRIENGRTVMEIGSGSYSFSVPLGTPIQ